MSAASQLTPHQQDAIFLRNVSIALSAGAGCGKTFVLTQRFLSHLEPGPECAELSELVAITFTDRAAREMRDRIRSACRQRLQSCSSEFVPHWLKILYGLDTARITTIHSFCTSLLRAHAVDAGLDPRFIVEDAARTDALIQRSARNTLHRLLSRQQEDAMALVLHFGLERSREILAEVIRQRFRASLDRLSAVTREEWAAEWPRQWRERHVPQLLQEFWGSSLCEQTRDWLAGHAPKKPSVLHERCQTVQGLLTTAISAGSDPVQWLTELREAAKVQGGSKSNWDDPEDYEALKSLWKDLRDDIDGCLKRIEFRPEDVDFAAELTERASRLAAMAIADYEDLKQQHGWLDFDDLLLRTRDLLRDSPHVARQLANGVHLLMVDEFQDTDQVQADIIRRLAGAALASGKLFLVGDAQQSIYRFRRADPDVFRGLRAEIPPRGQLPLQTNFRSVPDVLDFVNRVFQDALGDQFQTLTPSPSHQVSKAERKAIAPAIEFLWATSDVVPAKSAGSGKPSVEELRQREAEWIALRIAQLLQDSIPRVREKGAGGKPALRSVKPGDIVILFRTLGDVACYEAAFAAQGIDYYLVGGKSFYAQQEVFDLLNLCQWLDEPADEIPLVGCLRSPFFNVSDDGIHALKSSQRTLTKALELPPPEWLAEPDRQRIRFAAAVLGELRELKDRLPPSELLRTAVERTGYDAALLHEYLGERKVANLEKLIRQAAEFDDAEQFTLSDYVRQLERSVQDQTDESLAATLPEAGDVVRLMTIHQSKGLEFPVVFIADMNRRGNPRTGSVVMHPDWGVLIRPPDDFGESREHLGLRIHQCEEEPADAEEIQRLLYVAMTRAADRLVLSAGLSSVDDVKSPWLQLLGKTFDLRTGLPKGDPLLGSMTGNGADRSTIPEILVHREPPPVSGVKSKRENLVPLARLVEELSAAEPEEFPETARIYSPAADWLGAISVSRLESLVASHPTWEVGREAEEDDGLRLAADVLGTLVHRTLQQVDVQQFDQWESVLEECLAREALPSAELPELLRQAGTLIQRFVTSPMARLLPLAKTLYREIDFALHWPLEAANPQALLTGQIDVLLQDAAGTWHLLDYKTGPFPESVAEADLLAPYELQLGIYALAAERFLNRPLASIGLVALRPKVRWLKWDWNDKRKNALAAQIGSLLRAGGVSPLDWVSSHERPQSRD